MSIFGHLMMVWKLIGKHLLYLVLVNILSWSLKWIRAAVCWFVRQLSRFLELLSHRLAVFMPSRPQLTHLNHEVEVRRRRLELLGNLLGSRQHRNPVRRVAEPAVGKIRHPNAFSAVLRGSTPQHRSCYANDNCKSNYLQCQS